MKAAGPLEREIVAEIAAEGPMPFSRYMELCLYHPSWGYYTSPVMRVGRMGDFLTSPALSPAFGRTLARLWGVLADHLPPDRPPTRLVDVGAGDGHLVGSLVPALAEERTPSPREVVLVDRGAGRLEAVATALAGPAPAPSVRLLPDATDLEALAPADGLIIANELFDAIPFRRLRRQGPRLLEAHVGCESGRLGELWRPLPTDTAADLGLEFTHLPDGRECCVAAPVAPLVRSLASGVETGLVLVIDYGYPASLLYAGEGPGSGARGFRAGRLVDDLLADPGRTDLTAHVDFSAIDRAALAAGLERVFFCEQSYLLLALGFLDDPDAAAAKRLIHPEDMGGTFKCLLYGRGIDCDALRAAIPVRDRSRYLALAAATLPLEG